MEFSWLSFFIIFHSVSVCNWMEWQCTRDNIVNVNGDERMGISVAVVEQPASMSWCLSLETKTSAMIRWMDPVLMPRRTQTNHNNGWILLSPSIIIYHLSHHTIFTAAALAILNRFETWDANRRTAMRAATQKLTIFYWMIDSLFAAISSQFSFCVTLEAKYCRKADRQIDGSVSNARTNNIKGKWFPLVHASSANWRDNNDKWEWQSTSCGKYIYFSAASDWVPRKRIQSFFLWDAMRMQKQYLRRLNWIGSRKMVVCADIAVNLISLKFCLLEAHSILRGGATRGSISIMWSLHRAIFFSLPFDRNAKCFHKCTNALCD